MKIKKLAAMFLSTAMVLSLGACGGSSSEPAAASSAAEPAAEESAAEESVAEESTVEEAASEAAEPAAESGKSYHIGFALDTYSNAICAEIERIFEETCKERGYEFTVTDADGDASKQLADVSLLITKGVDAIVILPVSSNAVDEAVENAAAANIPIATVLRDIPNQADKYVCFSGTNDIELGEIGGQWIVDATGGKGNVVYITGRTGVSTAEDRTTGFHNIVDQYPDIKIVAEQDGNYNRADAMTVMETVLKANPEIDAVWCANDEMAGGVCQAINAAGREGILVGGANFQSDAYDRLMSGEQAADITTPCAMVIPAIDSLVTVLDGGEVTEKTQYYQLDLITKENADDFKDQLY